MEICGTLAAEYHDEILRLSVEPLIENIRCGEYTGVFSIFSDGRKASYYTIGVFLTI